MGRDHRLGHRRIHTYEQQLRVLWERGPRKVSRLHDSVAHQQYVQRLVRDRAGARGAELCRGERVCIGAPMRIGEAFNAMRRGDADVMIAGGSEAGHHAVFVRLVLLDEGHEHAERPAEKPAGRLIWTVTVSSWEKGAGILVGWKRWRMRRSPRGGGSIANWWALGPRVTPFTSRSPTLRDADSRWR